MKKGISVLLCVCMLLGACGFEAFAVERAETNILFSDDFESYTEGQSLVTDAEDPRAWTEKVLAATTKIAACKDESGMVMRVTNSNTAGKNGPRFEKHLLAAQLTNLTVTFRAKSKDADIMVYTTVSDASTSMLKVTGGDKWESYTIKMDLRAMTYDAFRGEAQIASGAPMQGTDLNTFEMHFSVGLTAGQEAYFDDIVFSSTDDVRVEDLVERTVLITPEEAMKPFNDVPAPALAVPERQHSVFTYDGSLNGDLYIPGGADSTFGEKSSDNVLPGLLDGQKVIRVTNNSNVAKLFYMKKKVTLGNSPTSLTTAYYANLSKSSVGFTIYNSAGNSIAKTKQRIAKSNTDWDLIEAKADFDKGTLTTYCNGAKVEEVSFEADKADVFDCTISYDMYSGGHDTMLMDNFIIHTPAAPDFGDEKYYGTTGTNWAKIGEPLTEDSYMSNLRPHPRMFFNDRQVVLDKINNIEQCAIWYETVKYSADWLLKAPVETYQFANGRNILSAARSIERRLMTLGFAYVVEQDAKYIERGLEEIRNAGTFPDWSNVAPMIPSELMYGIACFYDWCYYGLTESERLEIIEIVKRQALWQHVRSYDDVIKVEIARGTSNRTMLANACAAGVALAFADETPELSEFLFTNALIYGKPPVEAFGEDGGFPEGVSYWGLATEFMVYLTAQCETAFVEDFEMPEELAWYYENPMIQHMADYWMYTVGPKYAFNYGDADTTPATDPTPYWLAARYDKPEYTWTMQHFAEDNGHDVGYEYFAILYYDADAYASIDGVPLDKTFDAKVNGQVATFRSSWTDKNGLYAALQGGLNSTGHVFKSLGTFVVDANGKRFVSAIGRSNYSSLYDADMYYLKRAEGQNTLIANPGKGWDQVPDAAASFVRHEEAENEAFSILDMTKTNADFADAKRGMYMTKGRNSVVLQDEVKMTKPSELWWFAHTEGDIALSADQKSALLTVDGERMYVAITQGPADAKFEIMAAKPLPTSPVAPDEVYKDWYKLAIHMSDVTEMTLAVEFVPLKEGEAAPEQLTPVVPMADWKVSDNTIQAARQSGDTVTMLLGSPVVLNGGDRTYVDTANMDVYPFTDNGRTLVPVRFISESFGAQVNWFEPTQTVTVKKDATEISLQIGSNKMLVNGEEVVLDVPANTYNSRTLIPLRALVEALGKQVLWDDRGLISISDAPVEFTEEEKVNIISLLSERVLLNGAEMKSFTTDKTEYTMLTLGDIPTVSLTSGGAVTQSGNTASFTIGNKTYTISFVTDKFAGQISTNDPNAIAKLSLSLPVADMPTEPTWQPVEHVTFSDGHDKYVEFGTVDNIISDELVNRWSAKKPSWICYEFAQPVQLYAFGLAGLHAGGKPRAFLFNAEVSMDGANWEKVLDTQTSGTTTMPDIFMLDGKEAKYFRINGDGDANGGTYNSYTEVRFYTSEEQMNTDKQFWPIYFASGDDVIGNAGETKALQVTAYNSNNGIVEAKNITFTSADPAVVSVDANGMLTFVGKGETTITATYVGLFSEVTTSIKVICN